MITAGQIYWILKLDAIQNVFIIFSVVTALFCAVMGIGWGMVAFDAITYYEKEARKLADVCRKRFFTSVCVLVVLIFLSALTPSTKQMAMIKVIPAIANSEIVGEMSADAKEIYRMGVNAIKETLTGQEQKK